MLPISHDEVVHGKCSLINKMPGDYEQKFAGLRAFYGYMMAHPGKKLLFMGQEFAQFIEWNENQQLDWMLLGYDRHAQMQGICAQAESSVSRKPLRCGKRTSPGRASSGSSRTIRPKTSWYSCGGIKKGGEVIAVCNFAPVLRPDYKFGVPRAGQYAELINSDAEEFGGTGQHNAPVRAKKQPMHGFDYSISLRVPPMSAVILRTPAAKPKADGPAPKSRRPWRKGEAARKNRGAQNHRQTGEGRIGVPAFVPGAPSAAGSHKIGRRVPGAGKGEKNMKECIAMLLAGGQGSRLYALTKKLAKPAVPFGGKYRIIDFPLSNCVNSGIDTVGILTQYQPLLLNEYIGNGQPWTWTACTAAYVCCRLIRRPLVPTGTRALPTPFTRTSTSLNATTRVRAHPVGRPYL